MQIRLRRFGIIAVLLLAVAVVIARLPWVQIRYHRSRMQHNWNRTFEKPDKIQDGLAGYTLGESYERYQYHREELVKLGAVKKLQYTFKHIQVPSLEASHLTKLLLSPERPPCIDFESAYPRDPVPMPLTVWCYPEHAQSWDHFMKMYDVDHYREQFVAPGVARKSKEYIAGWSTMGMWLPGEEQIAFFRSNFELTQAKLAQALADADHRVRMRAAYVIEKISGEIGEEARSLGSDLLAGLRKESDRTVRLYLISALQAVRFNDAATVAELQHQFESLSDANTPLKPNDNGYAEVDERIHVAAALYMLGNSANRARYLEFVMKWLSPPPGNLDPEQKEGYWERRLTAVLALEKMEGATAAVPLLKAMLDEKDAKLWVSTHVPRVIDALREDHGR